ncbi:ABC transporter substrate-binding protein [Marinicrinis lubricantis]|uniref:Fe(3+) dicitrate ABC transporter substrate-binding protein n=1 Tax=Marinicrinis lubricantis TaxID=2086470 RepID=A0ABW1IP18_9BACL
MLFTRQSYINLMILILLTALIAGCSTNGNNHTTANNQNQIEDGSSSQDSTSSETRTIKHEMGETPITGTPKRIIALEFSYIDALAALDIKPIGAADDGDPNRLIEQVKSRIGEYTSVGTRKQPSLEIISSLQPDLIIADLKRHKDIYDDLQKIAPTIVLTSLEADYEGIMDGFTIIADAVGKKEEAEAILAAHQQAIDQFKSLVPADESRTVMPAVVTTDGFHAHSAISYTGSLLESIGLKNAIQDAHEGKLEKVNQYNKLNLEQVVEFDPDILFLIKDGDGGSIVDEWKNNPLWAEISAVKNDQVYEVSRTVWAWSRGLISAETILEDATQWLYAQ